jgi:hypothetical protein
MHFLFAGIALLLTSGANSLLLNAAIESYWSMAKLVLPLVVGTALLRVSLNQLSFGNYGGLKDILRDTIQMILLIAVAPVLIKNAVFGVSFIAEKLIEESHYSAVTKELELLTKDHSLKERVFSVLHIKEALASDLFQLFVRSSVLFIATLLNYLRDIILAVFISAMPLFMYLGLMLGLRFFINAVLSFGVTLVIWPILSALLMNFSMMVFKSQSPNDWTSFSQCASLLIYAGAQLLLPFLILGGGLMAASSIRQGVSDMGSSLMKLGGK